MDLERYQLDVAYELVENVDAWLRLPYDVKRRSARIELVDPATEEQQEAMQRNLQLHHPTKTLEGPADASLLLATRRYDLLCAGDALTVVLGTSLPLGRTEENPYTLGEAGLPHEHIQFGTGTFDPLLELHYSRPLGGSSRLSAHLLGRTSLYENDRGYRAPTELSSDLSLVLTVDPRLTLRAGWSLYWQNTGEWDGEQDLHSGLVSQGATAGAGYRVTDRLGLSLDVRVPVSQRRLVAGGEAYEYGTLLMLSLSGALGP